MNFLLFSGSSVSFFFLWNTWKSFVIRVERWIFFVLLGRNCQGFSPLFHSILTWCLFSFDVRSIFWDWIFVCFESIFGLICHGSCSHFSGRVPTRIYRHLFRLLLRWLCRLFEFRFFRWCFGWQTYRSISINAQVLARLTSLADALLLEFEEYWSLVLVWFRISFLICIRSDGR